ncbi:Glutamine synthetase adenylyl-L-tyrosine phosphorylase / Glutamine synthetase adenylyl transferase [Rhodovastum atsumiense]|uniref:Bifunctional glutamine synthetase adenylyltransferase/adenylyl-removing enzyme n=1 Tax=Rhodovastum atsumiense TaxID=504468 RepID=A0A5M6IZD8_9PROT|nr:bifunctional [glutamine synthetase] adenylyltransferase/[glutamine synthetase]-adenylyl-L-tyrosine phosphorylase [Rhodovastum atsumiense]KAA5613716.1 bifunctional [glutamine synthetase] adenylyltransferase/[glutamine synthetase]-adenylyl-L-tyrosine phosphorylase [Rhodovastum atsumiense]CAH2599640.1 Glutamine synthetase adenylyl-L-tyrosine phosphorylase / Glutamine synthetase adenylyl transferase [Rhodovastum atsumiense]
MNTTPSPTCGPGGFALPAHWPAPADAAAADRLIERFSALGEAEAALAGHPPVAGMLRALGGNSPYLADLAVREALALGLLVQAGPEEPVRRAMAAIAAMAPDAPRAQLAATLRAAKRAVALTTAVADIGGIWDLDRVTAALSDLAEAALRASVAHLLRAGHASGDLRLPDPEQPELGSGFVVLGMGKLGARELNYSSDVDLVLLQDPDSGIYHGDAAGAFYTRLARGLVSLMEARDANGYVFRTDLRLRPDPAATPPCIALPAAIAYYESMGQNWERAAMLKARPVAGDLACGAAFLEAIRPFVWRRHLDFAALADIHAMKRRIDAHKGTGLGAQPDPVARIAGHNVKLGEGGIREIEFVAQTLQLVWGGRNPELRQSRTLTALALLARAGHISARTTGELGAAYRFLRRVEHRLQMVQDRQTHSLPEKPEQLDAFAVFMGFPDAAAFAGALLRHLERVQSRYLEVFAAVPDPTEGRGAESLDFSGTGEAPPATAAALKAMGYTETDRIVEAVRSWLAGRLRALRSQRARELMRTVLPGLLQALARQPQPDAAFNRFDAFLGHLPAGVQLLSLFQHNPALLDRVAAMLGAAPSLADYIARTPGALEGLLSPAEGGDVARTLRTRLADARGLEEAIGIIRSTVRAEDFSISVATMEGRIDADRAGEARSGMVDAVLQVLLPLVLDDFAIRFGRVRGGEMAVVVLGKAGSREMMAGSDLDLLFVYDHPEQASESDGPRVLAASQWFIRAVHAYVAALTAPDAVGPMFAVDMRLRPSGNKGPVAVSLGAFERYHAAGLEHNGAWTWERMAMTRARVVAGPPGLRARVEAAIRTAISNAGPAERIRADAAAMRARMLRELPGGGAWDVKLRPGGQIEVEFIAQALQLVHAAAHPALAHPTTRVALARLCDAGLLPAEDAGVLIRADRVWRSVQGLLRISYGRAPGAKLAEATAAALLAATTAAGLDPAPVDLAGLRATLDTLAHQVRAAFLRHIGPIGGETET